jgi:3-carboxy-cis,cis-muconate cycloisomerase
MLSGLFVDTGRMRDNLAMTSGLIVAEAVMMGLAPHLGRNAAHDVVYEACRRAIENRTTLLAELEQDTRVGEKLSREQLAALVEPANYLGSAGPMVDRVLGSAMASTSRGPAMTAHVRRAPTPPGTET